MWLDCSAIGRTGAAISSGNTATPVGAVETAGGPHDPDRAAS